MIASFLNLSLPGPTPAPDRTPAGAGAPFGASAPAGAGGTGPRFADQLRAVSAEPTPQGTVPGSAGAPGTGRSASGSRTSTTGDAGPSADTGRGGGHKAGAPTPSHPAGAAGPADRADRTRGATAENRPTAAVPATGVTVVPDPEGVDSAAIDPVGVGVDGAGVDAGEVPGDGAMGRGVGTGALAEGGSGTVGDSGETPGTLPEGTEPADATEPAEATNPAETAEPPMVFTPAPEGTTVVVSGGQQPTTTAFDPWRNPAHRIQPPSLQTSRTHSSEFVPATASTPGVPGAFVQNPRLPGGTAPEHAPSTPPAAVGPTPPASPASAVVAAPAPSTASAAPSPAVRAWTVQQLSTPVVQAAGRSVTLPDGSHLATVRISPEALGPVTLEATHRDGVVRLEITAATDSGRENLRMVLGELRRELAAAHPGATLDLSSGGSGQRDTPAPGTGPAPGERGGGHRNPEGDDAGTAARGGGGPGSGHTAGAAQAGDGPGQGPHDGGTGTDGLDVYA
jgi:flagellar hook-length control protein FliK